MKRTNAFLAVLVAVALAMAVPQAYAALSASGESFNASDVNEINRSGPAFSKTKLGTRLRGLLQRQTETITSATNTSGDAYDADYTASKRYVDVTTVGTWGSSRQLNDGFDGQRVTFNLTTDGGQNFRVHPDTKSGYSTVDLTDAGDSITFEMDSDSGWFIDGNNGSTVNQ